LLARCQLEPSGFDSLVLDKWLKIGKERLLIADLAWVSLLLQSEDRKQAHRLSNIPFHRVQPVTAVGDVGDSQILATGQEVLNPLRNESPERNLKGQGSDIDVVVSTRTRMQVDAIATDSNGVGKSLRCDFVPRFTG